jgi:hypothetical protein
MKINMRLHLLSILFLVFGTAAYAQDEVMVVFTQVPPGTTITYLVDGEEIIEEIITGKEYPVSGRVLFSTRGILTVSVVGSSDTVRVMGQPNSNFNMLGSSILEGVVINPGPGPNLLVQSGGGPANYVSSSTDSDGGSDGNPVRRAPGIPLQDPNSETQVLQSSGASGPGPASTY